MQGKTEDASVTKISIYTVKKNTTHTLKNFQWFGSQVFIALFTDPTFHYS